MRSQKRRQMRLTRIVKRKKDLFQFCNPKINQTKYKHLSKFKLKKSAHLETVSNLLPKIKKNKKIIYKKILLKILQNKNKINKRKKIYLIAI